MIVLGVLLVILGALLDIGILIPIGVVVLIAGLVLNFVPMGTGPRRRYY
jgi:hypothetical protein